jgi:excisionase family DNA binding protein
MKLTDDPQPRLLSCRKSATYLGIPYTTLRDAALRGDIAVIKFGRAWYFERHELDALLKRNTERFGSRR